MRAHYLHITYISAHKCKIYFHGKIDLLFSNKKNKELKKESLQYKICSVN